jgi:formate transporter
VLKNLIPVTLGNILGGGVLVGLFHWLVFADENTREARATSDAHENLKEKHAG